MTLFLTPVTQVGRITIDTLASIGRVVQFAVRALTQGIRGPFYLRQLLDQMLLIGYFSLPVVGMTALFTGAALAQQIFVGSARFNAESAVAGVVVIAIVRELGPVLGGLMVAGRVSSAMAAELGAMRVTEQIDAMTTLSVNPYNYLIAPRLLAAVLVLPLLTLVANIIGVWGGYLVATEKLGFNPANYLKITLKYLEWEDVSSSLVKAAVFGFIIALMGAYNGFHSAGGASGVGRATTDAVVSSFILILFANLVITLLVFGS